MKRLPDDQHDFFASWFYTHSYTGLFPKAGDVYEFIGVLHAVFGPGGVARYVKEHRDG